MQLCSTYTPAAPDLGYLIMEHEEIFFAFGLSLTRKSFWKLLPVKLNDPVVDVGT
jgi:hypothetical protein